ncbi:hypothetical protein TSTA_060200 [Talaromyces stipitatus ATCC 10500]|uniref:Uncharacterized protein n=1 Tax=Talaromyces stipitatus (strain ATCC 10500 / CBS 375.48 / QM 6759 / NRRL 1006) TaxID=441959 RepID=B8LU51_TALSN|nr:uncharacterized protein TSTA_060200 [Talaromyces stipitatus ATCC 10500]EED22523.1 hypothetical protein TSTA_060200 [Talaromyces stipitatus ATCC 10500]
MCLAYQSILQYYDSQESGIGSRERSAYSRAPSSQYRGHAELRSMIHNLQQQLEEQRAEQKARQEKRLTQMEQQKAREEKLLDQLFMRLEHSEKPR